MLRRTLTLTAGLVALSHCYAFAQQPPVPTVNVVTAEKREISPAGQFIGRIDAVQRVDINARVTGYLDDVLFTDGQRVKVGDPLYRIEKGPFEASLQQAKANVLRNQAQLDNAKVQLDRAEELLKTNAGTTAARDDRLAQQKAAQGNSAAAEAELKTAEINLAYTDIKSPIDGRIGRTAVTRGNVVSPQSGVLAAIVSSDPMYVTIPVSQREFITLEERRKGRPLDAAAFKVKIRFANGFEYPETGKIDFIDNKVDRPTDTVSVRASLPNPKGSLVDGQLVQVFIESEQQRESVLVPQVALIADQEGVYVFIVDDGKLAIRRLKLGQMVGASVIVDSGLSGGELVVIGGQTLRPGIAVKAVPAEKPLGG